MIPAKHRKDITTALQGVGADIATIRRTNAGHICITLQNGRKLFTGFTPSDTRALKNLARDARRARQ